MRSRLLFTSAAFLAAAFAVGAASPAKAIFINVTGSDATTVSQSGGASSDRAQNHTLNITNSGTSTTTANGASVTGATRYTANVAADRGAAVSGGSASITNNVNYTVTLSVHVQQGLNNVNGVIKINTSVLGAATSLDDAAGLSNSGTASMGVITGKLGGSNNSSLSLLSAAVTNNGTGNTSGSQTQFSDNKTLNIPFSVTSGGSPTADTVLTYVLNFSWAMTASSPAAVNGGDEESVRLGGNGPLSGASADDYPGVGSRTQGNDGHFMTATVTISAIPEPSTLMLSGLGLCGLAVWSWRRRVA